MQSFVNAHFISKKLAEKFKNIKKESMLHFIFNFFGPENLFKKSHLLIITN